MEGQISLDLNSTQLRVNEGNGAVEVTFIRRDGSQGLVTVDYLTFGSTATAGSDYTPVTGTAIFDDGQTSQTITIPILEDTLAEGQETFSVTITNPTGGARLLAPRTATITIDDNDLLPGAGVYNGNQYLLTSPFLTWQEARAEAESLGGNLVTINDQAEQDWLQNAFGEAEQFWIGYNDQDAENFFQWSSGQTANYNNWATGEPNDQGGQDFVVMNAQFDAAEPGEWDDESETAVFRGIIEIGGVNASPPRITNVGTNPIPETVVTGLTQPTAIDWTPDGTTMFIGEKGGVIKAFTNGQLSDTAVIDLSAQVNEFQDRGLTDIAIHPDFFNGSPYLYALYTYDPPEVFDNVGDPNAGPDGQGNRAGRLDRITVDLETLTAVPDSEVILLGTNSIWDNFNGFVDSTVDKDEPPAGILPNGNNIRDFLAADSVSHSVGSVEFAPDGALIVSNGDGASFNDIDPRIFRVQDINNLSGKILRIDPLTGEGLADNPFYNGNPNSNRSKVYQYGLRNPFRFNVDPDTGDIYVGEVGWFTWEEINVGEAGANFGWPYYEGGNGISIRTPSYQDLPESQAFYASGEEVVAPIFALNHTTDNINAVVGGDIYRGEGVPEVYQGDLFLNDLGQGIVRNISFDNAGNIASVDIFDDNINDIANSVVQIVQGPDDRLYFVGLFGGVVGRWEFEDVSVGNPPSVINPLADIVVEDLETLDPTINLTNVFFDADGDEITYSIPGNSNPGLVSAVLDGNNLNLEVLAGRSGTANITVRATAGGQFVDNDFNFTLNQAINLDTPFVRFQNTAVPGTYLYATGEEANNIRANFPGFDEEGVAFNASIAPADGLIPLFRFQSTQRPGTYLFVGEDERNNINADPNFANAFDEEGIAFYIYGAGAGIETPFSRFQNTNVSGTYLYATGEEANNIRANFPGFLDEGVAFEARI